MATNEISQILLEMLSVLGKLDKADVRQLLACATRTNIPIGRVLVMCRRLTDDELTMCLEAAQASSSGQLCFDRAVILLKMRMHGAQFTKPQLALFREVSSTVLLLMARGLLSISDVERAVFTSSKRITCKDFYQIGQISLKAWKEGVEALYHLKLRVNNLSDFYVEDENKLEPGDCLRQRREAKGCKRLGEILVLSGILNEETIIDCLEYSLEEDKLFGQILIGQRKISHRLLMAGLALQKFIANRSLTLEQAVTILKAMKGSNQTIGEVMHQFIVFKFELLRLLVSAGVITPKVADDCYVNPLSPPLTVCAQLINLNYVHSTEIQSALRLLMLVRQQQITQENAINALKLQHVSARTQLKRIA